MDLLKNPTTNTSRILNGLNGKVLKNNVFVPELHGRRTRNILFFWYVESKYSLNIGLPRCFY